MKKKIQNTQKPKTKKTPVPFVINKRSLTKQYPLVHQKTPGDLTHASILEMEQIESVLGFFLSDHSPSSLPRQFKFPFVLTWKGKSPTSFQVFHVFHNDNQITSWIFPTWVVVVILWSQLFQCSLGFLSPYCFSNLSMPSHPLGILINAHFDSGGLEWTRRFASLASSLGVLMLLITGSHCE